MRARASLFVYTVVASALIAAVLAILQVAVVMTTENVAVFIGWALAYAIVAAFGGAVAGAVALGALAVSGREARSARGAVRSSSGRAARTSGGDGDGVARSSGDGDGGGAPRSSGHSGGAARSRSGAAVRTARTRSGPAERSGRAWARAALVAGALAVGSVPGGALAVWLTGQFSVEVHEPSSLQWVEFAGAVVAFSVGGALWWRRGERVGAEAAIPPARPV